MAEKNQTEIGFMTRTVDNGTVSKTTDGAPNKDTLLAVLQFLRKHNLKDTENLLKQEANINGPVKVEHENQTDSEVSNVLSSYKSEGDPSVYYGAYSDLKIFVENTLDVYRYELAMVLYPVFVHMYLELVYNSHQEQAIEFMSRYAPGQESYYQDDIKKLSYVTKKEHMKGNELMENFKSSHFTVRMSRDTYSILKRHLQERHHQVVLNIVQEHLYLDVYEGVPRNKQQIDAVAGAIEGEATRQANKMKISYGLPREPDIQPLLAEEEEEVENEGVDKPKKKKQKKDPLFSKKAKNDPNAPPRDRIPFPPLRDIETLDKAKAMREASKRITLSRDTLPSICFYTLLNSSKGVNTIEISEDSSLLAVGFSDSHLIRVWTLLPQKLLAMKSASQLHDINKEADDVLARMMDDRNTESCRTLMGHSGPVYNVSFSPDRNLLLSCSEDGTIRLWSLQLWVCLVCYKGHVFPVWDVKFSPHGYYFASCGHDHLARLWTTDHHQPLRLFAGHYSDVHCLEFHPNSNYIATGSSDRSVRVWDCANGNCVRVMTGHKLPVMKMAFSVEGRFLVSGGRDTRVLVWDLAYGHLLAELAGHSECIYSLCFSRCGNILASGSLDDSLRLWDFNKLTDEVSLEDVNVSHNPDIKSNMESLLLEKYSTKSTPVLGLHFTRRNLLLATGFFKG